MRLLLSLVRVFMDGLASVDQQGSETPVPPGLAVAKKGSGGWKIRVARLNEPPSVGGLIVRDVMPITGGSSGSVPSTTTI